MGTGPPSFLFQAQFILLDNFESFVIKLLKMQHLAMFKWHVSWARTDMNLTGGWDVESSFGKEEENIPSWQGNAASYGVLGGSHEQN